MSRNFGPVFTTISAISLALVWKFAPEIGLKLPKPLRDAIFSSVQSVCGGDRSAQAAGTPSAASAPAVAADRPTAVPDRESAARQPAAPAAAVPVREAAAKAPVKAADATARSVQNPTGSPYLEPAAKALGEYKKLSAVLEKKRKGMGMAEQRQLMKKLNALHERVEFYNRKHREWKQAHPAKPGTAR